MFVGAEIFHRLRQLSKFGWWPSCLLWMKEELESVVEGDITIVPQISLSSFLYMFRNPSAAMINWCTRKGMLVAEGMAVCCSRTTRWAKVLLFYVCRKTLNG